MRSGAKMMMLSRERDSRTDMRYPNMGYGMENRNTGTEMADRASRGTLTWDNTRGAESANRANYGEMNYPRYDDSRMNYPRSEMDEPEARRRRDSRGRFRSEMDHNGGAGMNYPMYPPPVYEEYNRPNQIGFSAHDGSERNNLHMIRGGAYEKSEKLDEKTIEKWMRGLQNEDGTVGAHWTKDQTTQVMKQKNIDCDPVEFYIAMNLMYSDFFNAAKKANANNVDFYVNMAKAFLDDKDAGVDDKIAAYYEYIVK